MTRSARGIVCRPLTPSRWDDLLELFGERGAYAGCWCMFFRTRQSEFDRGSRNKGRGNRRAFKKLVDTRGVPGLLAYVDGQPVGWCSVAPRSEFGRVERSPTTKPIDDEAGVWSIVCFYIDRYHRKSGVGSALLESAVEHARKKGARIVEGYPIDSSVRKVPNSEGYVGFQSMFEAAGFEEVARRSRSRPLMRYRIKG
jgi:GNAT superfamily N-acetyltransferase